MRCGGSCGVSLCWFIAHTSAGCVSVGGKRAGLDGVAGTAMMALRRGHRGATRESIVGRVQERLAILLPMTGILAPFSPRGEKNEKGGSEKEYRRNGGRPRHGPSSPGWECVRGGDGWGLSPFPLATSAFQWFLEARCAASVALESPHTYRPDRRIHSRDVARKMIRRSEFQSRSETSN